MEWLLAVTVVVVVLFFALSGIGPSGPDGGLAI